jgi:hypothetical protein
VTSDPPIQHRTTISRKAASAASARGLSLTPCDDPAVTVTRGGREGPAQAGHPSRRGLLRLAAASTLVGAGAAGCTSAGSSSAAGPSASRPAEADEPVRTATATDSSTLLLSEQQAAGTVPALARTLTGCVAAHRAHLAALGAPVPTAGPTPSGVSGSTATGAAPSAKALVAAEWAAAGRALAASAGATPAMATLLARIAAARAVNADLLGRAAQLPALGVLRPAALSGSATTGSATTGSATGTLPATTGIGSPGGTSSSIGSGTATASPRSAGSRQALADLLAGEHAATFAYGLLAGRAAAAQRALAQDLWQPHLATRDLLESMIVAAGDSPPVPAPAYDVGPPPGAPVEVAALAARVERSLASVASSAVAVADPDVRPLAAGLLVTAARRAVQWGPAEPLPGPLSPPASPTTPG